MVRILQSILTLSVIGILWPVAGEAGPPSWWHRIRPAYCVDYTEVVTTAARARLHGLSKEAVQHTLWASQLRGHPMGGGTLRLYLAAVNAVYRGPVQSEYHWYVTAMRTCLASDSDEAKFLH